MSKELIHSRRHSLTISSTINEKGSPIKKRICAEYLPKYHKLLKLSNKKISQATEDRLIQLTTKQIDRLIEMEKIKSLLNDNKKGIRPTHINFVQSMQNRHPNVYQPNFMSKINQIAIKRNIRHLKSQQFDQATLSPKELREKGLQLQKKNLRFIKQYKVDRKKKQVQSYEQEQEKSIEAIEEDVEQFEKTLQSKKSANKSDFVKESKLNKFRHKKTNILSMTRWFNGMSTYYLNLDRPHNSSAGASVMNNKNEGKPEFDRNFDFEYETNYFTRNRTSEKFYNSRMSTVA